MGFRAVLFVVLAALLTACAGSAIAPQSRAVAADGRIFDLPILQRDLDNGLRVVVVKTPFPDLVSLQIPVQTGARNEVEEGKSGFAHFFEHMMFRGTERVPAEQYTQLLKAAGADNNAYTSDDVTNYHTTFGKQDLELMLRLEADRFQNLKYGEAEFRTEALAVKGEYLKNFVNPIQKMFETVRGMAYTVHPYRHTPMGFLRDIEDMPNQFEYSRTFFDRWYRPEKTTVIVAGDVDPEATFALVQKHWGGWERGRFTVEIPQEPAPQGPKYQHLAWESPTQPQVLFAFRGPAFRADYRDMAAMKVLAELYLSETSDLYQAMVNEQRLADTIFHWFPERRDPGLLLVGARLNRPEDARRVAEAVLEALARARTEPVAADRLAEVKDHLRYAFAATLDNSAAIGAMLAAFTHFDRSPETLNDYYRALDALTPADLQRAANATFTDARRFVVSVAQAPALAGLDALPSLDRLAAQRVPAAAAVAAVELPSDSPLVDVALLFHTGAAFDPPGKKGLAALTAAMVTEGGSQRRTIREIDEQRFPMAADFVAQVDKEMTRFGGTVHRDNLQAWRRLALEQLLTPGWREDDFKRIRQQQANAIRTDLRANNDEELAKEVLYAELYGPRHPYGSLNLGALSDLERITLEDVKRFHAEHYTVANLTLGLAGGYGAAFADELRRDLARLRAAGRDALGPTALPLMRASRATIIRKDTAPVAVSFGWPIDLRRGDPDWVALWLVRSWLGEHRSSNGRLMQRIREARGLNYGSYAYAEYFPRGMFQFKPDPNLGRRSQIFQVWLRPLRSNNDALFATRAALFEIDRLVREGLTPAEFEATRSFLQQYAAHLVDSQSRALGYALDSRYYGVPAFTEYVREGLRRLTLEDVNRVIRQHLRTDRVQFVFVARDAAGLKRALAGGAASPVEYNSPKPEALLAEDRRIAAFPLGLRAVDITIRPVDAVFR